MSVVEWTSSCKFSFIQVRASSQTSTREGRALRACGSEATLSRYPTVLQPPAPGAPRLPTCFSEFKKKRNYVTYIMNMVRREFFSKLITENSADQGRLFRATKKLLCETNELFSPDYHDRVALANDIGRFFVRKFERIRCDIDALPDDLMLVNSTQLFSDFQPL